MSTPTSTPAEPGKWRQFLATVLINLTTFSAGMIMGWSSPVIPYLQSTETSVGTKPMTDDQISWLTATSPLGALAILPFCSELAERFGRKKTAFIAAVPLLLCWLLTVFATNSIYLMVARFLGGCGSAICLFIVPIYVSEISGTSVRGLFGSLLIFALRVGLVAGYALGAALSYQLFAISGLVVPVIFLASFAFMPETPIYLVRKGRIVEATRSLMWLKNNQDVVVEREVRRLQGLTKETLESSDSIGFRDLFRDRGTIRGLIIVLGLLTGQELSGISPMLSYTVTLFKLAGSAMSENTSAIMVGVMQIIGAWLSTMLMERAGRRKLLFISCSAMALCHIAIATFSLIQSYQYDVSYFKCVPVVALSAYGIFYCLGIGPVPFVIMSEVFSADILSFANSVAMEIGWGVAFLMTKFFPLLISTLGLHGCFLLLACTCMYLVCFTYFLVPETKGRTIESIIKELNDGKKRHKESTCPEAAVEMISKNVNQSEKE